MMKPKKIFMLGLQGAGKTTLAENLSKHLEIPAYYLDEIFFDSNWKAHPVEKTIHEIEQIVRKDKWVFDGCYSKTMGNMSLNADLCIFITSGRLVSYYNIIKRRFKSITCDRVGTPEGSDNKIYFSLLKKVWLRNKKSENQRRIDLQTQNSSLEFLTIKRLNKKEISKLIEKLKTG